MYLRARWREFLFIYLFIYFEKEKNNAKRKVLEALTIGQLKDAVMNPDNGDDLSKLWLDLM